MEGHQDDHQKWNQHYATKDGNIVGNKRSTVVALPTAPKEGVDAMLQCIARVVADYAPMTEEAMSNKKLYPGQVWRQFQLQNWTQLLRVTDQSFNIMCHHITAQHEAKPKSIRSKLTKCQVEEISQLAAMTSGLAAALEVDHAMPGGWCRPS